MARFMLDGRMSVGGVGRYRDELVEGLGRFSEHEVLALPPWRGRRIGLGAPFTPWASRRVGQTAIRWRADIVHGLHLELPKLRAVGLVVTIHDLIPLDFPGSMPSLLYRAYFRRLLTVSLELAAVIITPSASTASSLLRRGTDPRKIRIIPIGVDGPFRPGDEEQRALARGRFGRGKRYVACVAEPRPHKNRAGLFAVAGLLPHVTFACRGAPSIHAPENVVFIPRLSRSDLTLFYGGAEVLLITSFIEGYGLPALEGAACGTPIVSGPNIGVTEHLDAGVLPADPANASEMARQVAMVLDRPDLRSDLSHQAETAASKLNASRMIDATLAVYGEVLGET
jgi:glycosyltransferase involved in cell wall biosynthesis